MAIARPIRALALLVAVLWCIFMYRIYQNTNASPLSSVTDTERDPMEDPIGEPPGILRRTSDKYLPGVADSERIPATLLSLVRNEELEDMVRSMQDLERTWNHKFNYPWTFINDVPFTDEFKAKTKAATQAECRYEVIPAEHWDVPKWVDMKLFQESAKILEEQDVQYASKMSYHQMCRWNSGFFYKHPALADLQYYWRVEPNVKFFCDVDYDIFRYMQDNNKTYGFTINLYDDPKTIPTLWPETLKFIADNPTYIHENNAMGWLTDNLRRPGHTEKANGYSTCHFWSNFEVGNLDFFRSQEYDSYFQHLDRAGGFFYERWGDAPVHSIGLALFEDVSRIHWFRDIGYNHIPFLNCPNSPKCSGCTPGQMYEGEPFLLKEDCRPNWFKYVGMD